MRAVRIWLRAEWDRIAGTVCMTVGGLLLILTARRVAGTLEVPDQLAYIASGGLGGLFLLTTGVMLRLSADLHDEWRKLDRIEAALRGEELPDPTTVIVADLAEGQRVVPGARPHDANGETPERPAAGVTPPGGLGLPGALLATSTGLRLDWRGDGLARCLVTAGMGLAVAAAVVVAGWWRATGTLDEERALAGVAVGTAGLLLAAVAGGAYLAVLRRRVSGRRGRLLAGWLARGAGEGAGTAPGREMVAVVPGLTRFHREGCPTLVRADVAWVPREEVGDDLRPCQICGAT